MLRLSLPFRCKKFLDCSCFGCDATVPFQSAASSWLEAAGLSALGTLFGPNSSVPLPYGFRV